MARIRAGSVSDWQEVSVAKEDRGFASMDRAKQREIASKGGKAAHQKGTAHEWTSEEAREAGRKGGMASHRRRSELTGSQGITDTQNLASSDMSARDDSSDEQIR
ncbi:MAG TPA: KGG domain-containing protein [Vicinamibacterales bacterium]|jgi:general stress protein YciG|nr:KGG domain-containing protein [Vicinamibacterales bacterium]